MGLAMTHLLGREVSAPEIPTTVGPAYTLTAVVAGFLSNYLPRSVGFPFRALWFVVKQLVKPLDIWLNQHPNAHVWASLVYVLVRKA